MAAVRGDANEVRSHRRFGGGLAERLMDVHPESNVRRLGRQRWTRGDDPINNASLSGAVQEAFRVSIPFLPPIQLNPALTGSFRCE